MVDLSNIQHYVSMCSFTSLHKQTKNKWNFKCDICKEGASQKRSGVRRAYVLVRGEQAVYYCHNCGTNISFAHYLRLHRPHLYQQFQDDTIFAGIVDMPRQKRPEPVPEVVVVKKPVETHKILQDLQLVRDDMAAMSYLLKRKMPEAFIDELRYSFNYLKFVKDHGLYESEWVPKFDQRIVIPVFNAEKKLIHIQGRAINPKAKPKYLTVKVDENEKKIWGLDRVDLSKTVYVFEGVFDAIFIKNAIAGLGAFIDFGYIRSICKDKVIYCPDKDARTNDGLKKNLISASKSGIGIFVPPRSMKEKDINEMIQNGEHIDDIMEMINTNTFFGFQAEMYIKTIGREFGGI